METRDFERICAEKHTNIEKMLEIHDKRLNVHGDEIDKLRGGQIRTDTIVEDLCGKIDKLVDAMENMTRQQTENSEKQLNRWLAAYGAVIVLAVGFFIWYVQQLVVK